MGRRKGQMSLMSKSVLVKDRNKRINHRSMGNDSFLHTTELDDGITYNRINFQSVTEQNNLEDFLTTAEIAGKDFTAERQNVQIVTNPKQEVRLTADDLMKISAAQDMHQALLQIPRRPKWDASTTKEQLLLMERESFTAWRRQLKMLEDYEHIQLTPYEKNLDFWRQLWRVIERSDVVVQIVDARNPLLFRCADLDRYVKEVDPRKTAMMLINKADFLNEWQRCQWVEYFNREGITAVFFSAKVEKEGQIDAEKDTSSQHDDDDDDDLDGIKEEDETSSDEEGIDKDHDTSAEPQATLASENTDSGLSPVDSRVNELTLQDSNSMEPVNTSSSHVSSMDTIPHAQDTAANETPLTNKPDIVTSQELLAIFRRMAKPALEASSDKDVTTIGMVGYPNVGKSSTINVILEKKQLAVSATPGKTKHLQTLHLDDHLVLCDCPGLVFPSFVATKAHLVINGILPIDELRDHFSPVGLVCERIPRSVLEATYSLMIPRPSADDLEPDRKPTAEELLNAYGAMHGYMTARGTPDGPRSSRYILKDYVKGKLLYCEPPPGTSGPEFQDKERMVKIQQLNPLRAKPLHIKSDVDKEFFQMNLSKVHSKSVSKVGKPEALQQMAGEGAMGSQLSIASNASTTAGKPWKRHNNRNKKEKLRRLHRGLDVHS